MTTSGGGGNFDVTGNADQFAGPTPLISRFTASAKNANGDVAYRWRFDDGTTSEEQNPTHTFPRAGYYTVILDACDEDGNNDRQTFLLGAWPPQAVGHGPADPLTKKGARMRRRFSSGAPMRATRRSASGWSKRAREQTEG